MNKMTRNELLKKLEESLEQRLFLERLLKRPSRYAQFLNGDAAYKSIYRFIGDSMMNIEWLESQQENWKNNEDIGRGYEEFGKNIYIVFSPNERDNSIFCRFIPGSDSKNILFKFNMNRFANKKLDAQELSKYFQSGEIMVQIAHEAFHFVQFVLYPRIYFSVSTENPSQGTDSIIELEAYVYMILVHAILSEDKNICSYDEFVNYVRSLPRFGFLFMAIIAIENHLDDVKEIFKNNKKYFSESLRILKSNLNKEDVEFKPIELDGDIFAIEQKCIKFCIEHLYDTNIFIYDYFIHNYDKFISLDKLKEMRKKIKKLKMFGEEYKKFKQDEELRNLIRQVILKGNEYD